MSSGTFAATLDLAPRASARAYRLLFVLHAVLLILILVSLGPGVITAMLALGVGGSWLWLRRHAAFGYGPRALTRLTWHADGRWTVHDAAGTAHEAELLGDSLVHRALLVLNFRTKESDGRRTRVLLGDELDPELMRRLRARLSLA